MVKDINIDEFNYPLKQEQIAKFALSERDQAKLLFFDGKTIEDKKFYEIVEFVDSEDLLIFNDTKVVYARLLFKKDTGSKIEIFCLEPFFPVDFQENFASNHKVCWRCLIGNNKKWKTETISQTQSFNNQSITLTAKRIRQDNDSWIIEFSWDNDISFAQVLDIFGLVPLPPYLNRTAQNKDKSDYQTIYAHYEGSVAAPTAGLHFTDQTFKDLKAKGVNSCFVTLHVGAGTFKPVTSKTIGEHLMHIEKLTINKEVIYNILQHLGHIICVGTTSVRTIESLYWYGVELLENNSQYLPFDIKQWTPYQNHKPYSTKQALECVIKVMDQEKLDILFGQTQLLIAPSYNYHIVSGMVTNFHQPKSTLLLLVSAMIGDDWKKVYAHALNNNYRFLSYGDACLFKLKKPTK